jgi:hypothetical protein
MKTICVSETQDRMFFLSKKALIEALRVAIEQTEIIWEMEHYYEVKRLYESLTEKS